jgi:hypothetical protein
MTPDPLLATAYWILYHEVARDLYPEVPVHRLGTDENNVVVSRVYSLIATTDVAADLAKVEIALKQMRRSGSTNDPAGS